MHDLQPIPLGDLRLLPRAPRHDLPVPLERDPVGLHSERPHQLGHRRLPAQGNRPRLPIDHQFHMPKPSKPALIPEQHHRSLEVEPERHLVRARSLHRRPQRLAVLGLQQQKPAAARAHQLTARSAVRPRELV